MKNVLYLILSFFAFACDLYEDAEPLNEDETFGIIKDFGLEPYEAAARNEGAYSIMEVPNFGSVVCLSYSNKNKYSPDFVATGTLISSEWILTAGHNFFDSNEQKKPTPIGSVRVFLGNDPNSPEKELSIDRMVFHPTYLENDDVFAYGNDLCLLHLSTPVLNATFSSVNYSIDLDKVGSDVWGAGFGDYTESIFHTGGEYSKKHAFQNVLDRVVKGINSSSGGKNYEGGLLGFDFDSPMGNSNTLGDDFIGEDEKLLGEGNSSPETKDLEAGTVQGDSGSPLFAKLNGEWRVIGVLSGGASDATPNYKEGNYGDISFYIRTSIHASWIKSVTGI